MRFRTFLTAVLATALLAGAVAGKVLAERAPRSLSSPFFAVACGFTHRAPDDPIVRPNEAGATHLHDFFGNFTVDATSTLESLRAGGTRCRIPEDRSGYWVPTLSVDGRAVTPRGATVYYLAGRKDPASVEAPPIGLRVLAGGTSAPGAVRWSCADGSAQGAEIPACGTSIVRLHVRFPDCWNGSTLDAPDHRSHLTYAIEGSCPSSHPVPIPAIQLNVRYPIHDGDGVTLSSGGVETAHGDFFNAWNAETLNNLVQRCIVRRECARP